MTLNQLIQISCCFTGHRIIKEEHRLILNKLLAENIISLHSKGYINFLTGGALGFDTIAAQSVLSVSEKYSDIRLILVLPCHNQTNGWKQSDIDEYNSIISKASKVIYTSDNYYSGCMHKRNRFLVDYTSFCIAYQYKSTGGTAYTTKYAVSKGHTIVNMYDVLYSSNL